MRTVLERLGDMADSIDLIDLHLPKTWEEYDADIVMKYFLMKQVEIIGEASTRISWDFKDQHPSVPWLGVEKMRHVLVHDYFDVDWRLLWDLVQTHVVPLRVQIATLLHEMGER
ncbi:MAG: DUF86 domain-containing protein [Verrucomicrobiaceae bacterium]|nr:MAG: DUF86 domain-containing protein [Verrucomicrobiaceae bacterium]